MPSVQNYFSSVSHATDQYPTVGKATLTATIFGVFGGLTLLAAALFQALTGFGGADSASMNFGWWVRLIIEVFCGALFFVQQLVLHGLRFSLLFDSTWLFLHAFLFCLAVQGFIAQGSAAFYGSLAVAWFLIIGCLLSMTSCIISIAFYKKPV